MAERQRVVVTGLGVVSSVGIGAEEFWKANLEGRSGIGPIEGFDTAAFPVHFGGEVKAFDPSLWLEAKDAKRLDRYAQFAIAAAEMARSDASLDMDRVDRDRVGAIVGSGIGGLNEIEEQHRKLVEKGPDRVSPFMVPKMMINAAAGQIGIHFGLRGPNFATASACAASAHAIGMAFHLLRAGVSDVLLTGGAEASVTPFGLAGFCSARALSRRNDDPRRASRPFDKTRDGFVLGEGAAIVVLETLAHARARGARIYAELAGFGMSDDAHHITAPDPEGRGAALSMRMALADASLAPADVDYVNAHGTSTELNDAIETRALKSVFGDQADRLAISSTKSMIGHLLGASGAVELVATVLALKNGIAPPTINYETRDPECDLDYVPNEARSLAIRAAISNSFGFGGHNATVAVRRFEG